MLAATPIKIDSRRGDGRQQHDRESDAKTVVFKQPDHHAYRDDACQHFQRDCVPIVAETEHPDEVRYDDEGEHETEAARLRESAIPMATVPAYTPCYERQH